MPFEKLLLLLFPLTNKTKKKKKEKKKEGNQDFEERKARIQVTFCLDTNVHYRV
jgi:hypothetical protein